MLRTRRRILRELQPRYVNALASPTIAPARLAWHSARAGVRFSILRHPGAFWEVSSVKPRLYLVQLSAPDGAKAFQWVMSTGRAVPVERRRGLFWAWIARLVARKGA